MVALLPGCALLRRQDVQPATEGGRTVIRFWNGFTGPDGKAMERMVSQFREANPDVTVRMQIIPWGTYYDKLTLALAYGGAPEVFVLPASRLPEFASFYTLRPLSDLYLKAEPPLGEQDFAPVPWRASFFEGTQYGLPLDVHPLGMFCNTKLLRQADIARPPITWDEFLDAARRMTVDTDGDGKPDQWGFVFTYQRSNWMTFLYQNGGSILTPDGKHSALRSPEALRTLHQMRDLIYRYRVAPKPEGVDAWLAFRQGKVGMAMEGIYQLQSLQEQKGLEFTGAPVPHFGPVPATWGGSHLLVQPAKIRPERVEPAWRLMRFLSDHSFPWAEAGQVAARRSVFESPEFRALPVQSAFARELPYVHYDPLVPKSDALFQFTDPMVEAVLLDLQSPEEAAAEASRRIEQLLRRP